VSESGLRQLDSSEGDGAGRLKHNNTYCAWWQATSARNLTAVNVGLQLLRFGEDCTKVVLECSCGLDPV
jgi:hypothetical protein